MLQHKKVLDIPVPTWEEHEGSGHTSGGASFPHRELEMGVFFPDSSGKISRHSRHISRIGTLIRKAEISRGRANILKETQMSRSTPDEPGFPELPRVTPSYCLTPRWLVSQACGISKEIQRSWGQVEGKPDTAAPAQEKSGHACNHRRRGLTPHERLQSNPKFHSSTEEETSGSSFGSRRGIGPGTDWTGIPRSPSQLEQRLAFPEASREGP